MTEAMANLELNTFMDKATPEHEGGNSRKSVMIGIAMAVVLLIVCCWVSLILIDRKEAELLVELQARQELTVSGKADVVHTWIDQTGQRANLLTRNPLLQLFATEINELGSQDLSDPLNAQLPYMQNAVTRFVQENNLIAAYMIGKDGRAYLASSGSPSLSDMQRSSAVAHYQENGIKTTSIRAGLSGAILDFLVPVFKVQTADGSTQETVGVFLMTVPASQALTSFLLPSRLSIAGETTFLFQKQAEGLIRVTPEKAPYISPAPDTILTENLTAFTKRELADFDDSVFTVGANVDGTDFTLLQVVPGQSALQALKTYSYVILGLAASFFIVVISIVSGIWLSLKSQNAKNMANQYKDLAQQINAQRRLLGSINNTVHDLISLKDPTGQYVYANPALARFVDLPEQAIPGKTDRDLFGDKIARTFADMDSSLTENGIKTNEIVDIEFKGQQKFLRIEKNRLIDDDGQFMGIVTVTGDVTDYVSYQRQKDELGRKTISILVRMMEENDPHLAGHSNFMGELSANIAEILSLTRDEKQTLLTGANLSQIGKISIPASIRTKESRLTAKETEIMQGHVHKAQDLLQEMEIDQSIITAVCQMYERQDGSGYPNQLAGSDIDPAARILGMADVLVARVSPRSYRKAISVEEAMEVFRSNPEKYDPEIVQAFDAFLGSAAGQSFREKIEQAAKD